MTGEVDRIEPIPMEYSTSLRCTFVKVVKNAPWRCVARVAAGGAVVRGQGKEQVIGKETTRIGPWRN